MSRAGMDAVAGRAIARPDTQMRLRCDGGWCTGHAGCGAGPGVAGGLDWEVHAALLLVGLVGRSGKQGVESQAGGLR